jgi:hypothetical protein
MQEPQGASISINQMYELMIQLDKRLDRIETDLALIREKQSNEVQHLKVELDKLEKELNEVRQEVKQAHEKIANRDRTWVGIFLTGMFGFFIWLIQQNFIR